MKKSLIIVALFSSFCLTGCVEIVEKITVNNDGSGNVSMSLDVGGIGKLINKLNEYIDLDLFTEIKQLPAVIAQKLQGKDGLKNISHQSNEKSGLYSVSFDFKNDKDLNKTIYQQFGLKKRFFYPSFIKIKKHKIKKKDFGPYIRYFVKQRDPKIRNKYLLQYINYKSVIILPAEVTKVTNSKAKISNDKKSVIMECSLQELINTDIDFGNKITHK